MIWINGENDMWRLFRFCFDVEMVLSLDSGSGSDDGFGEEVDIGVVDTVGWAVDAVALATEATILSLELYFVSEEPSAVVDGVVVVDFDESEECFHRICCIDELFRLKCELVIRPLTKLALAKNVC